MNLRTKGVDKMEEMGPKMSDSCDIRRITLRTMSPRYIPPIIFSNPYMKNTHTCSSSLLIGYLMINIENKTKLKEEEKGKLAKHYHVI